MESFGSMPNFGLISLFLSMVLTWDKLTTESFLRPFLNDNTDEIGCFFSEYSVSYDLKSSRDITLAGV